MLFAAEMLVMVPSSTGSVSRRTLSLELHLPLVQSFKLLVLLDHFEKLSIRSAELQAAAMPRA